MRKIIYLTMSLLLTSTALFAQKFNEIETIGERVGSNASSAPCLNELQRAEIKASLNENVKQLEQLGKLKQINKTGAHPLFIWPVVQAVGSNYESIWGLKNYVDHDPVSPNMLLDYNCGERTFDNEVEGYNHKGTDILVWPFYWDIMDNDIVEVIAGDAGQIIGKLDGNDDRNCDFSQNPWNAVYLQHNDGSVSWYGNLKNGSLTSKEIGDSVVQGEFLGIVGSSGVSDKPHLHFEVYDSNDNLVDPYFGNCNSMNADSWWQEQKSYRNPNINAIMTHSRPIFIGDCSNTYDALNLQNDFYLGEDVYTNIYLRDALIGTEVHLKITDPNNIIVGELTHVYQESWNIVVNQWYIGTFLPNEPLGTWTFEVNYNGQTVIHHFNNLGVLGVEDTSLTQTVVYPNPIQSKLFIDSDSTIVSANIRDVLGKSVFEIKDTTNSLNEIDVSFLTKGIYFIILASSENESKTIKLIKE